MPFEDKKVIPLQLFEINTMNEDVLSSLIYKCVCVILIYDKTSYSSFLKVQKILSIISTVKNQNIMLNVILLQNKIDKEGTAAIEENEVNRYIASFEQSEHKSIQIDFFLISTKTKENIQKVKNLLFKIYSTSPRSSNIIPKKIMSPNNLLNDDSYNVFKIILLGDSTVGKTSFFHRFFLNEFTNSFTSTIGINETSKFIKIYKQIFKIQLWDTAGQERFRSIPKQYYSKADGIILLYDITNEDSFEGIARWVTDIHETTGESLIIYLVGNKIDLFENAKVSCEKAKKIAKEGKMKFVQVSCKWDLNVSDVTYSLIYDMFIETYSDKGKLNDSVMIGNESKKKSCC